MPKALPLPPLDYLRACFDLDANQGVLVWRLRPTHHFISVRSANIWNGRFPELVAGGVSAEYATVRLDGRLLLTSRVIFKMHSGEEPPPSLDHVDTDKANNRPWNLRPATNAQNHANRGPKRDNTTGYKGVFHRSGKFVASIGVSGKSIHLGYFTTAEMAARAYRDAAFKHHGEFARAAPPISTPWRRPLKEKR